MSDFSRRQGMFCGAKNVYALFVVQNPSGVPIYANQATLDYTGLTIDDVVSADFRARIFHPEDLERLQAEREAALLRRLPFEIEQRALRKDGRYRWFLIQYNPLRDEHGEIIRWYAYTQGGHDHCSAGREPYGP